MATVHQTQPTIQTLLSTNEFVGALDLISTTQEVLSQELAGVHSLRYLSRCLDTTLLYIFSYQVFNKVEKPHFKIGISLF